MNNLSLDVSDLHVNPRPSGLSPLPSTPSPISAKSSGSVGVPKEVAHELLDREPSRHRKQGDVPYPARYSSQNLNTDIIDHMIITDMCGGLTLQEMDVPPMRVLDLGCGSGMWILAAAKEWPNTTFVGLDIHKRQPDFSRTIQSDLSHRVHWVHVNFLEPLPFPDCEFDFIRMQNIGLGVPEDEWQNVIDEAVRVLKPGGSVEIIEEDIIFPCPDSPINRTPRASPVLRSRASRSHSGASRLAEFSDDDTYEDFFDDYYSSSKSRSIDTISGAYNDQRDHSKLKEVFMQMLSARFINPQILTVLPFYLQAVFREVQNLPNVKVYLPLPSGVVPNPDSDTVSQLSLDSSSSTTLVDTASITSHATQTRRSSEASNHNRETQNLLRARMHLYRTIETVRACKESIWPEFYKLHHSERKKPNIWLDREDFDTYFFNWECDMQDRIGIRDAVSSGLGISPPPFSKPEWAHWREKGDGEEVASFYASAPPDILRSMRGFVCKSPIVVAQGEQNRSRSQSFFS